MYAYICVSSALKICSDFKKSLKIINWCTGNIYVRIFLENADIMKYYCYIENYIYIFIYKVVRIKTLLL